MTEGKANKSFPSCWSRWEIIWSQCKKQTNKQNKNIQISSNMCRNIIFWYWADKWSHMVLRKWSTMITCHCKGLSNSHVNFISAVPTWIIQRSFLHFYLMKKTQKQSWTSVRNFLLYRNRLDPCRENLEWVKAMSMCTVNRGGGHLPRRVR